jgi:hypothetical protein
MRSKFICKNCGKETPFSIPTRISIVCQACGCLDISFDSKVSIKPDYEGSIEEPKVIEAKESFFGQNSKGFIWLVSEPTVSNGKDTKLNGKTDKVIKKVLPPGPIQIKNRKGK